MRLSSVTRFYAATVLVSSALLGQPQVQTTATMAPAGGAVQRSATANAGAAWNQLSMAYQAASGSAPNGNSPTAQSSLQCADLAKEFYTRFAGRPQAVQARKIEILLLANAIYGGKTTSLARIAAATQAFRSDLTIPAADRAEVAAAFEFSRVNAQGQSAAAAASAREAVARSLIKEYPDQAPGYMALLAQAMQHDDETARAMVLEVANSAGPGDVRTQAGLLANRLDLVGQSIDRVLGTDLNEDPKNGWLPGKPVLVYFWASWSPDSLALGEMLSGRNLSAANIVGVCIDRNLAAGAAAAAAHRIAGQLIYPKGGKDGALAVRLGATGTPLVYLTDGNGQFTDVRGADNMEEKLRALGL